MLLQLGTFISYWHGKLWQKWQWSNSCSLNTLINNNWHWTWFRCNEDQGSVKYLHIPCDVPRFSKISSHSLWCVYVLHYVCILCDSFSLQMMRLWYVTASEIKKLSLELHCVSSSCSCKSNCSWRPKLAKMGRISPFMLKWKSDNKSMRQL